MSDEVVDLKVEVEVNARTRQAADDLSKFEDIFNNISVSANKAAQSAERAQKRLVNIGNKAASAGSNGSRGSLLARMGAFGASGGTGLRDGYLKALEDQRVKTAEINALLKQHAAHMRAANAEEREKGKLSAYTKGALERTELALKLARGESEEIAKQVRHYRELAQSVREANKAKTAKTPESPRRGTPLTYGYPIGPSNQGNTAVQQARALAAVISKEGEAAARAAKQLHSLTNMRFALFQAGVSASAGLYGTIAALGGLYTSFMQIESAMARIQRTSGATDFELGRLRNQFIGLFTSTPTTWEAIDQIATLGGQLNIARGELAAFTRTAIEFSTTTNVSAEASAEAFGRLNGLMPDMNGQFDNLGAAILQVGVNSVATETDIISTANNIAAVGAGVGFTTEQIVGFSAAMSSLYIRPELARGGLTRIFGEVSAAIQEGGVRLENFAALAGQSADQFAASWRESAGSLFPQMLASLGEMQAAGQDLNVVLSGLGITNSRDVDVMVRMAQNAGFLGEMLNYASEGWNNVAIMEQAYAIQANTTESRLQVMKNGFMALGATIASATSGPFRALVDTIINLTSIADRFARTGIGQTLSWMVTGFGVVGIGALAFVATLGILGSSLLAIKSSLVDVRLMLAQAAASKQQIAIAAARAGAAMGTESVFVTRLTAALANLSAKTAQANIAMIATGRGTTLASRGMSVASVAATRMSAALNAVAGSGTLAGRALVAVQARVAATRAAMAQASAVAATFGGTLKAIGGMVAFTAIIGGIMALGSAMESTQPQIREWQTALDEGTDTISALHAAAAQGKDDLAELLGISDSSTVLNLQELRNLTDSLAEGLGWSIDLGTAMGGSEPLVRLNRQLLEIDQSLSELGAEVGAQYLMQLAEQGNLSSVQVVALLEHMPNLRDSIIEVAQATGQLITNEDGSINNMMLAQAAMSDLTAEYLQGSDAAAELAALEEELSMAHDQLVATLSREFGLAKAFGDAGASISALLTGFRDAGAGLSYLSSEGTTNVNNLQAAVQAMILAGQAAGFSATDSVNALFLVLQKNGIDTAALLSQLMAMGMGSLGGVSFSALNGSQKPMAGAAARAGELAEMFSGIAAEAPRASGGTRDVGDAAGEAANEIRTLVDYAGDLGNVMSRAFDIRFGGSQGLDKISKGWIDIRENIDTARAKLAEANLEIQKINAEMMELTADRSIQEYFLSIANAYGDTLRADAITAEIAKIDADLADKRKDLTDANKDAADATGSMSKTLVGNSKAAIDNRAEILDMVSSYQSYIKSLAASGAEQSVLQAETARIKAEFMQQATQLGYNSNELLRYAAAFDDVSIAITNVPRNITVTANTNPALQALNELVAQAASRGRSAGTSFANGFGGTASTGGIANSLYNSLVTALTNAGANGGREFRAQFMKTSNIKQQPRTRGGSGTFAMAVDFYKSGGYTGNGHTNRIAGVTHGKEYVFSAPSVRAIGKDNLEQMHATGRVPMQPVAVSGGGGVMELSAYDRQLIREAMQVNVMLGNQQVSNAVSAANIAASSRGSN